MITWLSFIYFAAAAALSIYGLLGLFTLAVYWQHRQQQLPAPTPPTVWPKVTVQLPVFNERYVVERLIDAAAALDYPPDRLQIQVLDDSTDETTTLAAARVTHHQQYGLNISLHHRANRQGYKAGALANGMTQANGEYIAIFDADFLPQPDFLRLTLPHLEQEPSLGLIQVRWDHLNRSHSPLTAAQAIAIDKHFAIDQAVRFRANYFPKFNGSGGVWRRTCLEEAGGWQDDTVCEDLCLSTRAVLKGWQFRFLSDVTAPAELPTSISAYKNQQARWAKGSIQCLLKYGGQMLRYPQQAGVGRGYAMLSMSAYVSSLLLIVLLLALLPLIYVQYRFPPGYVFFGVVGMSQPVLFLLAQTILHRRQERPLYHLLTLIVVAIGLAPAISRGIIQAVVGQNHPFIRTPKGGQGAAAYQLPFDTIVLWELGLALYAAAGLLISLHHHTYGPIFFFALCTIGFGLVGVVSLAESWRGWRPERA
ncbi:MAG: glycosyltransferase [Anaerolineae bacterium]|nr:glycosyltransferase [Anaerolineae bacterium]